MLGKVSVQTASMILTKKSIYVRSVDASTPLNLYLTLVFDTAALGKSSVSFAVRSDDVS